MAIEMNSWQEGVMMKIKKKKAEENTTVVKKKYGEPDQVLQQGVPNDHHRKQECETTTVGVNLGVTKNMDNYESLRVDCWLTDVVAEDETIEEAYERVLEIVGETLEKTVISSVEKYT